MSNHKRRSITSAEVKRLNKLINAGVLPSIVAKEFNMYEELIQNFIPAAMWKRVKEAEKVAKEGVHQSKQKQAKVLEEVAKEEKVAKTKKATFGKG